MAEPTMPLWPATKMRALLGGVMSDIPHLRSDFPLQALDLRSKRFVFRRLALRQILLPQQMRYAQMDIF
jgi:hypothetical protein